MKLKGNAQYSSQSKGKMSCMMLYLMSQKLSMLLLKMEYVLGHSLSSSLFPKTGKIQLPSSPYSMCTAFPPPKKKKKKKKKQEENCYYSICIGPSSPEALMLHILTLSTKTETLIPSKNTVDNGQNDHHYNKHLFEIHLFSYELSFHQEHTALNTRLNTNKNISDTKDILMVENCCPN